MHTHSENLTPRTILRRRTLADYLDACAWAEEITEGGKTRSKEHRLSGTFGTQSFTGTSSNAEFLGMLREGWTSVCKDSMRDLETVIVDAQERIAFTRNVGGAFPVVPAYLAGHPANMLQPVYEQDSERKSITLIVQNWYPWSVDADQCKKYAHALAAALLRLDAQNIRVDVHGLICVSIDGSTLIYTTPMHTAGDAVAVERVALCMHPSFVRRGWFNLLDFEAANFNDELSDHGRNNCYGFKREFEPKFLSRIFPTASSLLLLPPVSETKDCELVINEAINLKLKNED